MVAGAPLHIAAHLAACGWDARVVARVGDDPDGRAIRARLAGHRVDASLLEVDPALPTGVARVALDPAGVPTFTLPHPAAWDAVAGPAVPPSCDVLYFGTLPLRDPRSRAALARLLPGARTKAVDANLRAPDYDADRVHFAVAHADLFKASAEELPEVARLLGVPADPRSLFAFGPEWVCVTRGAAGAELHHRDGRSWEEPGRAVQVVDTVGAGDAFLAGLIDGLLPRGDGGPALRRAVLTAAAIVAQRGGFPEGEPVRRPPSS